MISNILGGNRLLRAFLYAMLMVFVVAAIVKYEPFVKLLSSGRIVSEYSLLLVFLEEAFITITKLTLISIGLAMFWSALGLSVNYNELYRQVVELYWVQFLAFMYFVIVVFYKVEILKLSVPIFMESVPLIQAFFLSSVALRDVTTKVYRGVVIITSATIIIVMRVLYDLIYESIISTYQ